MEKRVRHEGPKARKVETKEGEKWVTNLPVPPGFWDLWSENKDELKGRGISPNKYNGCWEISFWGDSLREVDNALEYIEEELNLVAMP